MKLLIMGPPGAGKGTQAKILAKKFNLVHLSTGDILRSEIDKASEVGLKAQTYMNAGNLVPDEILLEMMQLTLKELQDSGVILDGFPRTIAQAESLNIEGLNIKTVILFEVNETELIKRMVERGREDDTEESIKVRLDVYRDETLPLIKFYDDKDVLKTVDAFGDIDEIFNHISGLIKT